MKKIVLVFLFLFLTSSISAFSVGKFTISKLNFCGDGIVKENEECDFNDLTNKTCLTMGYTSGDLSCTNDCTFDESSCINDFGGEVSKKDDKDIFITRECNDGIDNDLDGKIDFGKDPGCTNILDDSEQDSICDPEWSEGPWSECVQDIQVRRIIDLNHCKSNYIKNETATCLAVNIDKKRVFIFPFLTFCFISAYFLSNAYIKKVD